MFLSVPRSHKRLLLYISPDKRFVSPALWDLSVDHDADDARTRRQLRDDEEADRPPVQGSDLAPVTIVVFSDFQCPFCKALHEMIGRFQTENPGTLKVAYRSLPVAAHPWASSAALAGVCVARQDAMGFQAYQDFVFREQAEITVENFVPRLNGFLGRTSGIDRPEYDQCMTGPMPRKHLEQDLARAREYDVHAVPTAFINGRRYSGFRDYAMFSKAVLAANPNQSPEGAEPQ